MDKKLRVGIIGCGGIANGKHMPNIAKIPEAEMVAFCDIVVERAEKAAKEYGVPGAKVYEDYHELLADKTIDVVHVLTPNNMHSPITVDALEAGKDVMCEKPMAKTVEQAKAMLDAAKRTGRKLTIGYQTRQFAESQYIKKACEDGELGDIYFAKAHAVRRRGVPTWGVFIDEEKQGGGPLIDIGTHALDLTLWFMNNYEPEMVVGQTFRKLADNDVGTGNAWGDWDAKKFTTEDSAFGFIRMKNGAIIELEASWALNTTATREAKATLCGTKAGATMLPQGGCELNGVKHGSQYVEVPNFAAGGAAFYEGQSSDPAYIEQRRWYDAVLNDTEVYVKPEQAFVVTEILEAIYTSAKTGKPVYFD